MAGLWLIVYVIIVECPVCIGLLIAIWLREDGQDLGIPIIKYVSCWRLPKSRMIYAAGAYQMASLELHISDPEAGSSPADVELEILQEFGY